MAAPCQNLIVPAAHFRHIGTAKQDIPIIRRKGNPLAPKSLPLFALLCLLLAAPAAAQNVATPAASAVQGLTPEQANRALETLRDDGKRNALYGQAADIAVGDMGVIPVYFTVNSWASRTSLTYDARADELSLAMGLRPAK